MTEKVAFLDEHRLVVNDLDFHCAHGANPPAGNELWIYKDRRLVERYLALFEEERADVIVELGVFGGASTIFLAELAAPEKLLAFELNDHPVLALDVYIEQRGLEDVVKPNYGVDQADHARLLEISRAELGSRPIDLVFDDASHFLNETRSSFQTLFPLVRPGGRFIIEDWQGIHRLINRGVDDVRDLSSDRYREIVQIVQGLTGSEIFTGDPEDRERLGRSLDRLIEASTDGQGAEPEPDPDGFSFPQPMTRLVIELMLAHIADPEVITEVRMSQDWLEVHRGPAHLDPETFALDELYDDHLGLLGG